MLAPPQRTVFIGTKIYRCIYSIILLTLAIIYLLMMYIYDYYTKLQFYTRTPGCHVQ